MVTRVQRALEQPDDDYPEGDGPWVECWQCHGEGFLDDCFEDCCVCLDPPCNEVTCDVCNGKGGWWAEGFEPEDLATDQGGGSEGTS